MTADEFRNLALDLPGAVEDAHMGHPDFRVHGKIFATLGPNADWAMVKLTQDDQRAMIDAEPQVFAPVNGAWGARGATRVLLSAATGAAVRPALIAAWRAIVPARPGRKAR